MSSAASALPRSRAQRRRRYTALASRRLQRRREQRGQTFEVEDPADQVRLLPDAEQPPAAESAQAVPVLALAEEFFDLLARPLREPVSHTPRAHADARMRGLLPARIYRDVGCDAPPEQRLYEAGGEEALVPAQGGGREAEPPFGPLQQGQAPGRLRRHRSEDFRPEAEQNPMPILHQGIDGIAGEGAGARGPFGDEPAVRIRDRTMGRVAA